MTNHADQEKIALFGPSLQGNAVAQRASSADVSIHYLPCREMFVLGCNTERLLDSSVYLALRVGGTDGRGGEDEEIKVGKNRDGLRELQQSCHSYHQQLIFDS